jgi:methylisocitrate lyase
MGYVACIEAQVVLCSALHHHKKILTELRQTGQTSDMTQQEWVAARQEVEDLIDLTAHYEIEAKTVEARQPRDTLTGA